MESTNSRALISLSDFASFGGITQRSIINIASAMFMERWGGIWFKEDCIEKEEISTSIVLREKIYKYKI